MQCCSFYVSRVLFFLWVLGSHSSHAANAFVVNGKFPANTRSAAGAVLAHSSISSIRPQAATQPSTAKASAATYTLDGEEIQGPLQPLRGMVLLEKVVAEAKTKGGLLLPAQSRKDELIGRVVAVGPGELNADTGNRVAPSVAIGEFVMFSKHGGEEIKYGGSNCVLLSGDDILAKITAAPEDLLPQDVIPLGDTVFVQLLKSADRTASGLLLSSSDQTNKAVQQAVVIKTGPGRLNKRMETVPMEIKAGERILYSTYAQDASELRFGDQRFGFVNASDISAKW